MKKLYETLSVDVVKFEAQDVITASGWNENNGQTGGQNGNENLDGAGGAGGTGGEIVPPKEEVAF